MPNICALASIIVLFFLQYSLLKYEKYIARATIESHKVNHILQMNRVRKEIFGLILILVVIVVGIQVTNGSALPTDQFRIYEGQLVYETAYSIRGIFADEGVEWDIETKITDTITVTLISSDIVRFSVETTFKILSASLNADDTVYTPETQGFRYLDAGGTIFQWFNDTETHQATSFDEVRTTTGIIVRTENPMGLSWLDVFAVYEVPVPCGPQQPICLIEMDIWDTYQPLLWTSPQEHTQFYSENSTSVNIGDWTMWGIISDFTTVMDRRALVVTATAIQAGAIEYMNKKYYDVISGLLLGSEYVYVSAEMEIRSNETLIFQTVLDTTFPTIDHPDDLAFEEGTTNQWITWNPTDIHPSKYNITQDGALVDGGMWDGSTILMDVSELHAGMSVYTCTVSDESGQSVHDTVQVTVSEAPPETTPETTFTTSAPPVETTISETTPESVTTTEKEPVTEDSEGSAFVPSFAVVPALFGLAVLRWFSQRTRK